MTNSKNHPKGSRKKKNRIVAGAHAGRGFRYQDKFGALLAVQHYDGSAKVKKIIPEGIDDFEVYTEAGVILIDTKSNEEGSRNRTRNEDAGVFQKLWRNSEELTDQAFEFRLVLNRGHKSYYSKLNKTPITETRLSDHPKLPSHDQKYSMSFVVIEPDPISKASNILIEKHDVLPIVAETICLNLSDKLGSLASQNKSTDTEKKYALFSSEIPSIIDRILKVCKISEVKALLVNGGVKYVDFRPADISSGFYLNVDVRPGHITAGQVVPQSKQVKVAEKKLKTTGSCLVTGPSGSGKSALMWQIVHSTREEVCWFEVTNRQKLDSKELTLFLNATRDIQRIGFVLDNINYDRIQLLEQLIEQTRTNENVWILGSVRTEYLCALTFHRSLETLKTSPDIEVAKNIFENLRERKLTKVPYFKEAWQNSNNLLLEYTFQLVEDNTLEDTILEQLRSKQKSFLVGDSLAEDEFVILQAIMPVTAAQGKVDTKTVRESLGLTELRFSAALQRLQNEFLILDHEGEKIDGLHALRSMSTCNALIRLGISTKSALAKSALLYANPNSLENVTFFFVYQNWLKETQLTSVIRKRLSEPILDTEVGIAFANGVRRGKLHHIVEEWYKNHFLTSAFTPSIVIPIAFYSSEQSESPFPPNLHRSASKLNYILFEQVDNIVIPECLVTRLLEYISQNYSNSTSQQIVDILHCLSGSKLNTQQINLLRGTKLDFSSMSVDASIAILESIENLSEDVYNDWIDTVNEFPPEQRLLQKFVRKTPFALPIKYERRGHSQVATAYFANPILNDTTVNLGQLCRDYSRTILTLDDRISMVRTGISEPFEDEKQKFSPIYVDRLEPNKETQAFSEKVARAIVTSLRAKTWSHYLYHVTEAMQSFYELSLKLLNELCRNTYSYETVARIRKVVDEMEKIVPPKDKDRNNKSSFLDISPIHGITDILGLSLTRYFRELPKSSVEFLAKIHSTRNALNEIRNEPWYLTENGSPEVLSQLELLLNKLEDVVSDSKLNNAHPFEMYPNTKTFSMNSFDYFAKKCSESLAKRS